MTSIAVGCIQPADSLFFGCGNGIGAPDSGINIIKNCNMYLRGEFSRFLTQPLCFTAFSSSPVCCAIQGSRNSSHQKGSSIRTREFPRSPHHPITASLHHCITPSRHHSLFGPYISSFTFSLSSLIFFRSNMVPKT